MTQPRQHDTNAAETFTIAAEPSRNAADTAIIAAKPSTTAAQSHQRTPHFLMHAACRIATMLVIAVIALCTPTPALADEAPAVGTGAQNAAGQGSPAIGTERYSILSSGNAFDEGVLGGSVGDFVADLIDSVDATSVHDDMAALGHAAVIDYVVDAALAQVGAPYSYGGTSPSGFDCSGLMLYVFRNTLGMELPRTAAGQASLGTSVSFDQLQKGDLLFWGSGSGIYHVGMYVENGTYVHAAGSGKGVRVQSMDYFTPTFAKRVL